MASQAAGGYKWRTDEYYAEQGDTLYAPDWQERDVDRYRTFNRSGKMPRCEASPLAEQGQMHLLSGKRSGGSSASSAGTGRRSRSQAAPFKMSQPVASSSEQLPARKVKGLPNREGWNWCMPKDRGGGGLLLADEHRPMMKSLSSPTTLTQAGKAERMRVMGGFGSSDAVNVTPQNSSNGRVTLEPINPIDKSTLPQTTNQMYGARASQFEPPRKFFPKSTCDVVMFTDNATKTLTPYNHAIRF